MKRYDGKWKREKKRMSQYLPTLTLIQLQSQYCRMQHVYILNAILCFYLILAAGFVIVAAVVGAADDDDDDELAYNMFSLPL